jgi:hypothetical protein
VKRSRLISDITSRVDKLRKREDFGAGFLAVEDSSELISKSPSKSMATPVAPDWTPLRMMDLRDLLQLQHVH